MTFASPLLLLTLLAVPAAAALYVAVQRRRIRYAVAFTNLDVLAQVVERHTWRRHLPPALFAITLVLLCIAVARPQERSLAITDGSTVVLVVDASLSMRATDVKPSRLAAAKAAVRTFLDRVPSRLRVGLVVFAGDAQVGAPPATDRALVRESVDSIGSGAFGGTAIGDALVLAVELAGRAVGTARGLASILFLSDGRRNQGNVQPLEAARRARQAGMRVYTIALGTDHGRLPLDLDGIVVGSRSLAPDPATLRAIAQITGGEFFRARSARALQSAYAGLGARLSGNWKQTEITYAFLAIAGAFLLGSAVLSALWSPRLP